MDLVKQQSRDTDPILKNIQLVVLLIGIGLVIGGAASLLYIGYMAFEVIKSPADSALIQWIFSSFANEDIFIQGHLDKSNFEIRMSPVIQYFFYGIIGLMFLRIVTSIIKGLISGGIKLIQAVTNNSKKDNNH